MANVLKLWGVSSQFKGERLFVPDKVRGVAVYTQGVEFVVRSRRQEFPVVAGPFSTFEAALAATLILNEA